MTAPKHRRKTFRYLTIGLAAWSVGFSTLLAQVSNPIPGVVPWSDITILLEYFSEIPASSGGFPYARINHMKPAGDGTGRLFANDLNGRIYLVAEGSSSLFLDLKGKTSNFKSSPGLGTGFTSFTFHPEYGTNGKFYTSHSERAGSGTPDFDLPNTSDSVALQGVITEWTATDSSANVFAGTRRELLRVNLSGTIHGMQEIEFNLGAAPGEDDYGKLFICIGDGGSTIGGYPENTSRLNSHQGTILRIDPMGTNSANGNYGVPATNPWASDNDAETYGEIWAYGFRNPHRITWDPAGNNIMLTATIGERNIEEINQVEPGNHYGWNHREGTFVINSEFANKPQNGTNREIFPLPDDDAIYGYTYPVAQYDHDEGRAVAGGYIYRGIDAPHLVGKYIFGEITDGIIYFVEVNELEQGSQAQIRKLKIKLDGVPSNMQKIIGRSRTDIRFGYDEEGGLYITEKQRGKIYKVVGSEGPFEPPPESDVVFSNLSTRGVIGGNLILTPGIVIGGTEPKMVLIRAIGPTLRDFGVMNAVSDTTLTLYNQSDTSTPIATNINWGDADNGNDIAVASAAVGAFTLPADSKDSAILMVLQPGAYTAQASGTGAAAGVVLTEVYSVE